MGTLAVISLLALAMSSVAAAIALPEVYALQLSGEDTNSVGFTTYSYYVAQTPGNFMARTDTLDGGSFLRFVSRGGLSVPAPICGGLWVSPFKIQF